MDDSNGGGTMGSGPGSRSILKTGGSSTRQKTAAGAEERSGQADDQKSARFEEVAPNGDGAQGKLNGGGAIEK